MRPFLRLLSLCLPLLATPAWAEQIFFADQNGRLGYNDNASGEMIMVGQMPQAMTDIAFTPDGEFYGITADAIYRINPETAETQLIGEHGIPNADGLTAGPKGRLFAVSSSEEWLYRLDTQDGYSEEIESFEIRSGGGLMWTMAGFLLADENADIVHMSPVHDMPSTYYGEETGLSKIDALEMTEFGILGAVGTVIYKIDFHSRKGPVWEVLDLSENFDAIWGMSTRP
ncbi:MAG: hypothetical protein ACPGNV_10220 [Mangrovicoccus sp.]